MTNGTRTFEEVRSDVKRLLGEGSENGWIFGVCATIARRSGWELWAVRSVAAVLFLLFSLASVLAYFVLAMLFHETRPGAQRKLTRWARRADDGLEVLIRGLKGIVTEGRAQRAAARGRDQAYEEPGTGEQRAA
jgi:phage shock protein PspC (stress-responsive transcriptional regulator)